ncbi:hypothetical protein HMPREF9333_02273 [Johnsonella ignava ATCC 51276]|jgi:hypothetical protein|uniref:Uncharacterized protein n=1 Tax=Johnsonella ignava ATCC 51276 TaxID=679200 RepID=G5GL28_9FIRM|nr:hypothetical protein [Johnsonella ignava]EHI54584.1 hypothetical protein HMPREF9333_02273 [Johnsonella ignava ATCC 51276]
MTSKKKATTEEIKKNFGFDEQSEQAFKSILGVKEEKANMSEEIQTDTKNAVEDTIKRRGRKKLENREKKKRYSLTILPSIYEKAQEKAEKEGKTISELVSNFLLKYSK